MSTDWFVSGTSESFRLARLLPPGRVAQLEQLLALTADPVAVRTHLIRAAESDRAVFERVVEDELLLGPLLAVFAASDVLAREFISQPESWLPLLDPAAPVPGKEAASLREKLLATPRREWSHQLVEFRRRSHFQILARDATGRDSLKETVSRLSATADTVLAATLDALATGGPDLQARWASPESSGLSILAAGKLGGEELNYSSDLDLIYIYDDRRGDHAGLEYARKLVQQQLAVLAEPVKGSCAYRVDLRLRPEGRAGDLVMPWTAALRYYEQRARTWERQMLLKVRVVAGDPLPGSQLLTALEPLVYPGTGRGAPVEPPFAVLTEARRRRTPSRSRAGTIDIKRTPGGIRDIEFLVQGLQRQFGAPDHRLRVPGTLAALERLRIAGRIDPESAAALAAAYTFYRQVEHYLQVREDHQTHAVPRHGPDRERLARLMAARFELPRNGAAFDDALTAHLATVQQIVEQALAGTVAEPKAIPAPEPPQPFGGPFSRDAGHWLREQLVRFPLPEDSPGAAPEEAIRTADHEAAVRHALQAASLQALARSVHGPVPLFSTLAQLSQITDAAIDAALRLTAGPGCPLWVIALGRLGMLEFDLGSDADLVFVVPDAETGAIPFWTDRVQRLITLLSTFTPAGRMVAVDTRLRCGGRDGPLVQPTSAVRSYFEHRAQPWEGLAWMKARAVAGDRPGATAFLREIQEIEEARWAGSDRARVELRQVRQRIEREFGRQVPLKAGPGAYYDIDFALLYLRLRGARTFYPALQTPERINVLEQTGSMTSGDADFLRQAALFHRAVDHGMRLESGSPARNLPRDPVRLQSLAILVKRWLPAYFDATDLKAALLRVQSRTRNYFDRLFTP